MVERAVADAVSAKEEIEKASTVPVITRDANGQVMEELPGTDEEHLKNVATGQAEGVAQSLPDAKGHLYLITYMETLAGTVTPLGPLLDHWNWTDRALSKASRVMDKAAFQPLF